MTPLAPPSPIPISTHHHLPITLTHTNFTTWRMHLSAVLNGFDLFGYINGKTPQPPASDVVASSLWFRQDQLLLAAIVGAVSPDILPLLFAVKTSADAWDTLNRAFASTSRAHVMQLKTSLAKATLGSRSISEYVTSVKAAADELGLIDAPVFADDLTLYIINGLGPSYREIVSSIRTRDTPFRFEELRDRLIEHELYLKQSEIDSAQLVATANMAQSQPSSGNPTRHNNNSRHSNGGRGHSSNRGRGSRGRGNGRHHHRNNSSSPNNNPYYNVVCQLCGFQDWISSSMPKVAAMGVRTTPHHWHARFGHPSRQTSSGILSKFKLPVLANSGSFHDCISCNVGKSHRLPFGHSSFLATRPLDYVFADVWGPSPSIAIDGLPATSSSPFRPPTPVLPVASSQPPTPPVASPPPPSPPTTNPPAPPAPHKAILPERVHPMRTREVDSVQISETFVLEVFRVHKSRVLDTLSGSHHLGSTSHGLRNIYSGIFDSDKKFNPDFYNWHKAFVHSCDGSIYMSDVEEIDRQNNLSFRGARIYRAMIEEMLSKGMGKAENAILAGTSAGGMSTIFHCDGFRALFSRKSRVKCIFDSGLILRGKGAYATKMDKFFVGIIETHKLAKLLPESCTSIRDPNLCLYLEYLIGDVKTPLFLIESTFDQFQIGYGYIYSAVRGQRPTEWVNCNSGLAFCNSSQLEIIQGFRPFMIETISSLDYSSSRGIFADSCYIHTHIENTYGWMCSTVLAHKTIGQAVGDWYFDRSTFREIETDHIVPRNCNRLSDDELKKKCTPRSHSGSTKLSRSDINVLLLEQIFYFLVFIFCL
ncbi:hypothetical protein C2S52_000064 [Perilla frutescens var. hirtella]|nr:hypothetical protein C2S52_000064 [Perilla frutescens var. hirtella]